MDEKTCLCSQFNIVVYGEQTNASLPSFFVQPLVSCRNFWHNSASGDITVPVVPTISVLVVEGEAAVVSLVVLVGVGNAGLTEIPSVCILGE